MGRKLEMDDQVLLVDDIKVNGENVVELVRGSNLVGTKVRIYSCQITVYFKGGIDLK